MDKTVNVLILIIVFVFDPLAICLVLAANFAFGKAFPKKRENIYGEKVVITQTPIVELEADPDDLPDIGENKPTLWEEEDERIDVIGQNGNTGLHYEEEEKRRNLESEITQINQSIEQIKKSNFSSSEMNSKIQELPF